MTKNITRALLLFIAVFAFAGMAKAQMGAVPVDKDVRIGQLPNGLTYYIRHNETPKGQADFYIAQKVGSILEEDNQRGLAHFLEHMCFNGTKSFPGNQIVDWLETKGVKFGYNLNAYTSVDETVYNISNVPVADPAVVDSCLLILHDWANDLLLEPEEIDKERGVIHQEWRMTNKGTMRIYEKLLPVIYPGSRYGERLPIGTMEVVDNFPYQALRDYYEAWYRPDQQGVIVVGDIDVDVIEGKIKEMFSGIEMPENAPERVYFPVDDTPGTIYAIGSDPEQTNGVALLMWKTDAFPNEAKTDMSYLIVKYIEHMIVSMLDQRLTDMCQTPDAPFAQAGVDYDNFFLAKTKDCFELQVVAKGNDLLPGFEAAYREVLRALQHGFTVSEYERAKAEYLSRLEKAYNGRDKRQNDGYVNEYVRHFIDNEPIPSIKDEYEIMQQIVPMLPLEAVNSLLPELITSDNRVLMALIPDNGTFKMPTQQDFEAAMAKIEAESIEAYKDTMKEEPLIPKLPKPGKIKSVTDDSQWGAKVVTLSNGVKVYVKTTDFKKDEILFNATAVGGTSTIGDDQAANLIFMPYAMSQNGLGDYSNIDLQKYLAGKQVGAGLEIDNYSREVTGSSTVKDLPTLFELIYMTFVDYQLDPVEYAALQEQYASILANQEANPQFAFNKALTSAIYKSAASQMITPEIVRAADRQAILDIIHASLANAADYTFFFVGDVTVDQIAPLLEQYIATLPANPKKATKAAVVNTDREIAPGAETTETTFKMETPETYCAVILEAELPYSAKERVAASMAGQILGNRLLKKIREEMGAVYSISASCTMGRVGKYNTRLSTSFPMKPELKAEVLAEIDRMIREMQGNVTDDELNPIKEFMVKNAIEEKEQNDAWLGTMGATVLNGVDVFNGNVDTINSVTVADIQALIADLLSQGNYRVVILDPAE